MARNVYTFLRNWHSCAKAGPKHKHERYLQIFSASRPLEFLAMILDPLPKTTKRSQHVVANTNRYSKLTRVLLTAGTTRNAIAWRFIDGRAFSYGILPYLLTDNSTQFDSKFNGTICTHFGILHVKRTAHPQTNKQVNRYKKAIVTRLCHYAATHQRDWDLVLQPLTYASRTQVHRSINITFFCLVHTRRPPGPTTFENLSALATDANHKRTHRLFGRSWSHALKRCTHVYKRLYSAQEQYDRDYNTKLCCTPTIKPGQIVYNEKTSLASSSAGNAKRLTKTCKKNSMFKELESFAILSVQQNTLTINKHGIHNTVSIDRATLVPGKKSPTNASERLPL